MATKRIKFIKPWAMVSAGEVRDFDTPVADELIRTGRAQEVQPPAPAPPPVSKKAARREARNAKLHS
jgi:hypothetical protein